MTTIKTHIFSGIKWNAIGQISRQSYSFVISIILARLLTPEEFGLIAMLFIFSEMASAFINSGLGAALIQKKNVSDVECSTVFYFSIVVAFLIYILFFFSSSFIASFYNESSLEGLIKFYALAFVIQSFALVQGTLLVKNLNYKANNIIQTIGAFFSGIVVVIMAYYGAGVYSLVGQALTLALTTTLMYVFSSDWKPTLQFSTKSFKEMYSFGLRIFVVILMDKVFNSLDNLVIGKAFSAQLLGFYNRGKSTKNLVVRSYSNVVTSIVFPIFSKIHDPLELKKTHNQYLGFASYIVCPIMAILFIGAEPIVQILYGQKWIESIPFLEIFCLFGVTIPFNDIMVQTIMARGEKNLFLRLEIIKKIVLISSFMTVPFGVEYFLYALCVAHYINVAINMFYVSKVINTNVFSIFTSVLPGFYLSLVMAFPIYYLDSYIEWPNYFIQLLFLIITGIVVYLLLSFLLKRKEYLFLYKTVIDKTNLLLKK